MKFFFAIGGLSKSTITLFEECNVERMLVSYADVRGKQDIILPKTAKEIILDSGAFSVTNSENKISLTAYTLWLKLYLDKYPQIVTYINLDDLENPDESWKNLQYMESEGLSPMPVYHYSEPTEVLNKLCSKYEYVGLGGMAVGTISNEKLRKFWEWVDTSYKDNRFHILGVGSLKAFYYNQPYSLDATSWNKANQWGQIAGYKNGLPEFISFTKNSGIELFFTPDELNKANIRAMKDWEKLEWLQNVPKEEGVQTRFI